MDRLPTPVFLGFSYSSAGKESACNAGGLGLIPGLGRSPGEGKGYPLQYSGLENSMECIVHGIAPSWTSLQPPTLTPPMQAITELQLEFPVRPFYHVGHPCFLLILRNPPYQPCYHPPVGTSQLLLAPGLRRVTPTPQSTHASPIDSFISTSMYSLSSIDLNPVCFLQMLCKLYMGLPWWLRW